MRSVCSIATLLVINTTLAAAAQIPAGDMPGRERERFIERPGEQLLLRRAPNVTFPDAVQTSPRKCGATQRGKQRARKRTRC
jgi:hypothetical protein